MQPLPTAGELADIALVATDVDGTLTRAAKLDPAVVSIIATLAEAGIEVMPVSGRSAGEVLGLVRYLPGVRRGIAENGLVEIVPDHPPRWLAERPDRADVRRRAEQVLGSSGVELRPTSDDAFRLGDLAYERDDRSDAELARLAAAAPGVGLFVTWSTVHVHFTPEPPDKGRGLLQAAGLDPSRTATIGDAPNDAGLFVAGRFRLTVGTADVLRHRAVMPALPQYVTSAAESAGFLELAHALLAGR